MVTTAWIGPRAFCFKPAMVVIFAVEPLLKKDPEYLLLDEKEFGKVGLRNQTLSWKNVQIELPDLTGNKAVHPYDLWSRSFGYSDHGSGSERRGRHFLADERK
jgi:hypothetical protein